MNKIIQNAAYCMECGEIVISTHVHDFKECSCGNIWVDGGTDYLRMGGPGFMNNSYFDLSICENNILKQSFFDFYENFLWGTRGVNGDEPLTYVFIKDLTKEHLHNILIHVEKISEYHKQAIYYWLYKNFDESYKEIKEDVQKNKFHKVIKAVIEWEDGTKEWWIHGKKLTEEQFNIYLKSIKQEIMKRKNSVIDESGTKIWYNEKGMLHNEDIPAIEYANRDKFWYDENGQLHREDGAAMECADGYKAWYIRGNRHREDGPAVEYANGDKIWYINGKYHREDGPAIEYADGDKEWWINNKQLTEEEFNLYLKSKKSENDYHYTMGFIIGTIHVIQNHLKYTERIKKLERILLINMLQNMLDKIKLIGYDTEMHFVTSGTSGTSGTAGSIITYTEFKE